MQTYTDLSEALKEQDKVQILDLSNQGLTEIPLEIGDLINLTALNLKDNSLTRSHFISTLSLRWDRPHEKMRDTWSTVDPIAWQCGPSWSAKRWCALFFIVFASLVGDDHLVFGSSAYFFRCATISSMCWLAGRLGQDWLSSARVKPMWLRPRSLPPLRPNKGSLREE